eukprot:CAMPEP_0118993320 /NCGR_PEP_ID=MMETSP1173-20130426/54878_1 /TAXON_ID=1034831 /ORGANISM="Rhizochromulina marina cf, Strain CCMP1243" /LENGTH=61 /DNA_ID=CAMNT_0006944557 /DNA_START=163 /DNA_END=349 /DNA_ORIENTATION=-
MAVETPSLIAACFAANPPSASSSSAPVRRPAGLTRILREHPPQDKTTPDLGRDLASSAANS